MSSECVRGFPEALQKVLGSKHNGPKQLIFAIALANTKLRQKQQSEVISTHAGTISAKTVSTPFTSHRHRLLEGLALLKILGPQIVGFLSSSEASIPTFRLITRMAEACENVAGILRQSTQLEGSKCQPDSMELFDMLWDSLNVNLSCFESTDKEMSSQAASFEDVMRRYRSDIVTILSRQISNCVVSKLAAEEHDPHQMSFPDIQAARCKLITCVASTSRLSCEACISSLCTTLEEVITEYT